MASLTTSASGFLTDLDGLGFVFGFFAFGGVCESSDSSSNALSTTPGASSSESGVGRFFGTVALVFAAGFSVPWGAFFAAALLAVVLLGAFRAAFAFGFWRFR